MQEKHWKKFEPLSDLAYEKADEFLASPTLDAFKELLRKAIAELPKSFSVSFEVNLVVFDSKREARLPLSQRALCINSEGEPYLADADSTSHRFVVNGEVCQVPHDRCPNCWQEWAFKIGFPDLPDAKSSCPSCGYAMGQEIKILLDNDVCPHCEQSTLSYHTPKCNRCGFFIDTAIVAWG